MSYKVRFTATAETHYDYFLKSGNRKILKKISQLLSDIPTTPYSVLINHLSGAQKA